MLSSILSAGRSTAASSSRLTLRPLGSARNVLSARPALPSAPKSNLLRSYSTPTGLDEGERNIYSKLSAAFPGQKLEVQDVSGGCGSFYSIIISSPKFNGLSTIKQHKLVNQCLKEDIEGIHGLQLKTIPEEA